MTDETNEQAGNVARQAVEDAHGDFEAATTGAEQCLPEQDDIQALVAQLAAAQAEAAAANDKYLRARADMENFKKRVERTYADRTRSARKDLLTKLLGVKDNLERALHYASSAESGESIVEGVRLTQYQLDQLLQQEGVTGIEAEGKAFDPHLEEAIQSVNDASVPDHTVVQVVRAGYTLVDRFTGEEQVLRPAQVIVSVHQEES